MKNFIFGAVGKLSEGRLLPKPLLLKSFKKSKHLTQKKSLAKQFNPEKALPCENKRLSNQKLTTVYYTSKRNYTVLD